MFSSNINMQALLLAFGLFFILFGWAACLGYWKKWFWQPHGAPFGYIPIGCLFIVYAFDTPLRAALGDSSWLATFILALLAVVGLWWSIRPPNFLKPRWVHWVEKYPADVVESMRNAAKAEASWGSSHTTSEEAVDAWVKTLKGPKNGKKKGK